MAYPSRNVSAYTTTELSGNFLLQEIGDLLLQENGDGIVLDGLAEINNVSLTGRNGSTYTLPTRN